MSDYSDCYFEANKAEKYRKEMIDNLAEYEMTRIMFADFLAKKSDSDAIDLVEKFLD